MKKIFTFLAIVSLSLSLSPARAQVERTDAYNTRMQWWSNARFGMFIHWGLYAVPAGEWNGKTGYGEWIRNSAEIPLDVYDRFRDKFNPVNFNADLWVRMAKDAGMKYIVITSKHHDGFCMFDTKQTEFCIRNTPFGRDPMKDLADACRKEGIRLCFYYSIMDWHHPDYLPRRDWEKDRPTADADFNRYIEYMKEELRELIENYGDIGVIWFDGQWESTWNERYGRELYDYCRAMRPGIIINNRVSAGKIVLEGLPETVLRGGDYGTPEQEIPATGLPGVNWETCMTMNDHWGYNKADKNFKSTEDILHMLADIASKGGNYLLNVGPTALGEFPPESVDRLREIGDWMKVNGQSIYGTQASPFKSLEWGRCTRKELPDGTRLYLHVFNWPTNGKLVVPGCLNEPAGAFLLADTAVPLAVTRSDDALVIRVPAKAPDRINSVVVLDLKGKADLTSPPEFSFAFDIFTDSLAVSLSSDRAKVSICYTLDGTTPTIKSVSYSKPVMLKRTTIIKARCFRDGSPVSGTSSKEFRKISPLKATELKNPVPGMKYRYFEGTWDSLPDMNSLKAKKEGIIDKPDLGSRKQDEYMGFEYKGYILVPLDDVYGFSLSSDDGSKLFIDGKLVVDNDGLHAAQEKSGSVALAQGYHAIRVEYFNKTGDLNLDISIMNSKMQKQVVQPGMLFH
jgi:alpha-L-fucosidase